jgi:hypothetical protein
MMDSVYTVIAVFVITGILILVWIALEVRCHYRDKKWRETYDRHRKITDYTSDNGVKPPIREDEPNTENHPMIKSIIDHIRGNHDN